MFIRLGDQRTFNQLNAVDGFHQRTGQWREQRSRRIGCCLTVLGIFPPQNVAGVFEYGVLKTATRAEERSLLFAGKADRSQRTALIAVGTGWHAPEAIEVFQRCVVVDVIGGQPLELYVQACVFGCHAEGDGNRLVGGDLRVVIADQGDADDAVFHECSPRLLIPGTHYRLAFTHSILALTQVINAATHYRLEYPDLSLILALVRGGSLARASALLKVDVSTVFRAVRRLEAALGQQLFEKSRAGYLPTSLAQTLAEQAERAEQALEAARIGVEQGGEVISGTVRLTCTDSVLQGLLLPALAQFMPGYPALTLELSTSNDFANLSRRDADIALRLTQAPPEHLVGRRLAQVSYRVCASTAYLKSVDAQDLASLTWIAPDDFLPDHPTVAWRRQHLPGVTPGYRCNSMLSVTELVRAGLGVAALPDFLIGDGLQPLSEPLHGYDTALWLLTRPDCRALRSVVTLFDELGLALKLP